MSIGYSTASLSNFHNEGPTCLAKGINSVTNISDRSDIIDGGFGLRAQPVDATLPISIDRGLKCGHFPRRDVGAFRNCVSTSVKDQETSLFAISADPTSTCCRVW
jgi:hypothetical protein